jgi:hypothetical protein
MPSTSETGHAKNVANFEDLISFCSAYGATYNPSKESLSVVKLKELQTQAKEILQQVKTNKTSFDNATNARQIAFKDLKPLATKIVNALSVSGATNLVVANATTVNRKIQGTKANGGTKVVGTPTEPNAQEPTAKTISTSQQSYDSLIDHFTKIIETVSQESSYKPNEIELKTTTLQTKLTNLKTTNTDLINGYTNWSNTRIQRNSTLYSPLTGLVQTALDVKKYVKSVFGATSPQFKQVSGLEFSNIKDR